jgi:hypothetical protein
MVHLAGGFRLKNHPALAGRGVESVYSYLGYIESSLPLLGSSTHLEGSILQIGFGLKNHPALTGTPPLKEGSWKLQAVLDWKTIHLGGHFLCWRCFYD